MIIIDNSSIQKEVDKISENPMVYDIKREIDNLNDKIESSSNTIRAIKAEMERHQRNIDVLQFALEHAINTPPPSKEEFKKI